MRAALATEYQVAPPQVETEPVVDGALHDAVWQEAQVIEAFTQVSPNEGAAPTERTRVRVMFTPDALCVGIRCFDQDASKILARDMRRDSSGSDDDRIRIVLDPYGRGTEGYVFSLTAGGAKRDGIIETRSTSPRNEWDTIWFGRASVDAEGWSAEMVIPFRSVAFSSAGAPWGFNIERTIRRRQETVRWATPVRSKSLTALETAGEMKGIRGVKTGLGLDVRPTAVARWSDDDDGFDLDPSFDAFYRVTPSLTATFTYNTDFAEAEVDERRVNLTRFPLFFTEKRSFFLEDATRFNFGGIHRSPLPFHSRRIGLSVDGERVPIRYGSKLTGKAGPWNIGLLGVALDDTESLEADEVFVTRMGRDVGAESSIGGIYTFGDPRRNASATTQGVDFRFKNSRLIEGKTLELIGWGMRTETEREHEDEADDGKEDDEGRGYGLTFVYPNRPVYARVGVQRVGEHLTPATGFVRRPGIYEFTNFASHRWYYGGWLDTIDLDVSADLDTDLDLKPLSEDYRVFVEFENVNGDAMGFGTTIERERLREDFEIFEDVVIPENEYRYARPFASLETSQHRPLNAAIECAFGDYFDGSRTSLEVELGWRPGSLIRLFAGSNSAWIDLPGGEFETLVARTGTTVTPAPHVRFDSTVQFDTVSDEVGLNARCRWIVQPGSDLFLVYNQGYRYEDHSLNTTSTEAVTKLGWTVRF